MLKAVNPLLTLSADLATEKEERGKLQVKLDAIELADKEAKATEAQSQISAALKDGRLSDDAEKSTSTFWLSAFEGNFELAEKNLKNLPKHQSASRHINLSGDPIKEYTSGQAFAERQKEIESKRK